MDTCSPRLLRVLLFPGQWFDSDEHLADLARRACRTPRQFVRSCAERLVAATHPGRSMEPLRQGVLDGLRLHLEGIVRQVEAAEASRLRFRPASEVAAERGLVPDTEDGTYSGAAFDRAGLPMVVACTSCEHTMVFFSALVDQHGRTWCRDCGGEG